MMSNKCSNFDHIERCAKQEEEEKKLTISNDEYTNHTFDILLLLKQFGERFACFW